MLYDFWPFGLLEMAGHDADIRAPPLNSFFIYMLRYAGLSVNKSPWRSTRRQGFSSTSIRNDKSN